jgi:hypothetical protein
MTVLHSRPDAFLVPAHLLALLRAGKITVTEMAKPCDVIPSIAAMSMGYFANTCKTVPAQLQFVLKYLKYDVAKAAEF